MEKEKDPLAVELGRRGGLAKSKLYGREHYQEMAYKSAKVRRLLKKGKIHRKPAKPKIEETKFTLSE